MKAIVFLIIAGVAAVMAYLALQGECAAGMLVSSEEQCRRSGEISAAACSTVFANAERVARAASNVYASEQRCMADFPVCTRSSRAQGYVPVPVAFCVSVAADTVTRQEPVYRRINAAPLGGRN